MERFDAQGSIRNVFADAPDGVSIRMPGYKYDGNFARFSKPLGCTYPVPTPIEIHIHQDKIGLNARCQLDRFSGI
jgi:hypothetical protein